MRLSGNGEKAIPKGISGLGTRDPLRLSGNGEEQGYRKGHPVLERGIKGEKLERSVIDFHEYGND